MNSLIKSIKRNTEKRKLIKKRIDDELNLSVESNEDIMMLASNTNRLIDEGAIIEGDGSLWAYIKKGTLEKFMLGQNVYLPNLPEDFVGNINVGHMDHVTFPFPVGEWRKEDMKLVDIGDGRQAIDIDVTLDEESVFIQELKRLGNEVSMSVEAYFHLDEEATDDLGVAVIDEVLIYAYAIVGDGKNVNSNGLKLKGEDMELPINTVIENENDEVEVRNDEVELAVEEDEVVTESEEEAIEEVSEVSEETAEEEEIEEEETEDDLEEVEEVEVDEVADEEDEDEEDEFDEIAEQVETLNARIGELETENNSLKAHLEALKKDNRRLSAKLQKEKEKKEAFFAKAKGISVKLGINEGIKEEKSTNGTIASGDGIGD